MSNLKRDSVGRVERRASGNGVHASSDLEPVGGSQSERVALDETVVEVNGERF